ncbi:uncharacterized protein MONBRDRAFT_6414 [Monosiga brevicollis MX1]|uniref:G-patch domain-containing protein n=1 Tax=Monosiga brevicollis TaxID=81824 RepID=A9UTT1_MONBE|nr:uncharacterized protein MONBRDRAFT_6414 [Monosiga brevicollis MX1]EDQ91301.1 predicted protein [Monosiga brevicollis MX1]|eukprot:XP_001743723.1 hypothetical protein [Monosiga brevicollis MX1]
MATGGGEGAATAAGKYPGFVKSKVGSAQQLVTVPRVAARDSSVAAGSQRDVALRHEYLAIVDDDLPVPTCPDAPPKVDRGLASRRLVRRANPRAKTASLSRSKLRQGLLRAAQDNDAAFVRRHAEALAQSGLACCLDDYAWTPLMIASAANALDVVHALEEVFGYDQLDYEHADRGGNTALSIARQHGHEQLVDFLVAVAARTPAEPRPTSATEQAGSAGDKTSTHPIPASSKALAPQPWFCAPCGLEVREAEASHCASIAHNINCARPVARHPFVLGVANKGYQLMKAAGWNEQSGLGPAQAGRIAPVKTVLKRDRAGLASAQDQSSEVPAQKAKVTHFKANDLQAVRDAPRPARRLDQPLPRKVQARLVAAEQQRDRDWRHMAAASDQPRLEPT